MSIGKQEFVELHVKIPQDVMKELNRWADQRRVARTQLIEDSLREHLRRISHLENTVAMKEKELAELEEEMQPAKDMIDSFIDGLLSPNSSEMTLGWEYERIANFFLRALRKKDHIYIPIDVWRRIKEALPPTRKNPFSPLTDYEHLCKILYPADPYYFERCLQEDHDIYLVKAGS